MTALLIGISALVVVVVATIAFARRRSVDPTREEVADILERFLGGTSSLWEFDDLTSIRIRDPDLQEIVRRCVQVRDEFPPETPGAYTSPKGEAVIRACAHKLRGSAL